MREILEALFNRCPKITIQHEGLSIERILGSATGGVQLIQGCVQFHQLIVAEFRVQSCVIAGAEYLPGTLDHFVSPVFGGIDRSVGKTALADVPTPAHSDGLVRFRKGPNFLS